MRIRILSLLALVALLWPAKAQAASITIQTEFIGVRTGYVFEDVRYPDSGGVILGSVLMSGGSTDLAPELQGTFEAYCVDINGPIFSPGVDGDPPKPYNVDTSMTMTGWNEPGGLNTTLAGQRAAWLYNTYAGGFDSTQLLERTALQMAIWEVLYDKIPNVIEGPGSDRFAVATENADVAGLASFYLGQMLADSAGVSASNAAWLRLSFTDANNITTDVQDFIGPRAPDTSVPEPSAGLLLGMGMTALAAFRSRKSLLNRG